MTTLVGTGLLVRAILRRDRVRILVWVGALVLLVWTSAVSVESLYPTTADLERAAAAIEGNAAAIAFNGPQQGLGTLGGRIAFEVSTFGMAAIALMSVFMVTRNSRAEEESGRLDLICSTVVGRHAPLAAALVVPILMNLVIAAAITLLIAGLGVSFVGSAVLGLGFLAAGLTFVAVASVTAQVTDNTRVANGLAGIAVGLSFMFRAVGDVGDGTLSWLSPIGWAQKARPFAGEQWWPLLIALIVSAGTLALAAYLAAHRDLGGGLIAPRAGPAVGPGSLSGPLGLAWRLQRGAVLWWSVGVFALGCVYGSIAQDISDFLADNDELRDILARGGGDLVESYFGTCLLVLAVITSGFTLQGAQRLRSEEAGERAEPLLATPVSRVGWLTSHLAMAMGGSVVVLGAAGAGVGVSHGLVSGEWSRLPELVGGALAYLPAVLVLASVALAIFGLVPRFMAATWGALVIAIVVGFFGELLRLPSWVARLSPFEHVPFVPADPLSGLPLAILTGVALGLTAAGTYAFRQRDLG